MLQKKLGQKGFTIVELLIVIIVIGVLVVLVVNVFAGVLQRERDNQRQSDIISIATQLELYYDNNGTYPSFGQISSAEKAQSLFQGVNLEIFNAPGQGFSLQGTPSTNVNQYGYVPSPLNCAGTTESPCSSFVLTYTKEGLSTGEANPITKQSIN